MHLGGSEGFAWDTAEWHLRPETMALARFDSTAEHRGRGGPSASSPAPTSTHAPAPHGVAPDRIGSLVDARGSPAASLPGSEIPKGGRAPRTTLSAAMMAHGAAPGFSRAASSPSRRPRKGSVPRQCSADGCERLVPDRAKGLVAMCGEHRRVTSGVPCGDCPEPMRWCYHCKKPHGMSAFADSIIGESRKLATCARGRDSRRANSGRNKKKPLPPQAASDAAHVVAMAVQAAAKGKAPESAGAGALDASEISAREARRWAAPAFADFGFEISANTHPEALARNHHGLPGTPIAAFDREGSSAAPSTFDLVARAVAGGAVAAARRASATEEDPPDRSDRPANLVLGDTIEQLGGGQSAESSGGSTFGSFHGTDEARVAAAFPRLCASDEAMLKVLLEDDHRDGEHREHRASSRGTQRADVLTAGLPGVPPEGGGFGVSSGGFPPDGGVHHHHQTRDRDRSNAAEDAALPGRPPASEDLFSIEYVMKSAAAQILPGSVRLLVTSAEPVSERATRERAARSGGDAENKNNPRFFARDLARDFARRSHPTPEEMALAALPRAGVLGAGAEVTVSTFANARVGAGWSDEPEAGGGSLGSRGGSVSVYNAPNAPPSFGRTRPLARFPARVRVPPVAVVGRAFHIRGVRAGDRVHVFGQKMRPFSALVPDDAKGKGSQGGSEGTRGPDGYSEYSGPSDSEEDYDSEYSDSSKRATSADAGALGSLRVFVPAPHPRDPDPPIIDGFLNVQVVPRGRDAAGREFVRVLLVSDPEAARELDALRRGAGGGAGRESAAPDPDANHPIDDAETNTTRAPRRSRRLFERSTSRAVFGGGGGGDSRRGGALPARARGFDCESAFARFLADLGRVLEGHGRNWLYDEHARAASRRVIAGAEAALSERDAPALLAALRDVADDLDAQEAAEREEEETGGPNASAARHHHLENVRPAGEEAPFDDDAVAVARLATRGSGVKPFGDRSEGPEGCEGVSSGSRKPRSSSLRRRGGDLFGAAPKDPKGRRAPALSKCSVLDKDPAFRAWYSFHFRSSLVFAGCVLVLAWKSRRWGIAEGDVAAYFGVSMLYPLAFGVPSEALRAGLARLRRALEGTAVDGVLRGASFELLTLLLVQRSNGALRHRLHGTWNEEWGAKETVTDPRWVVGWACAVANLCVHAMCHARAGPRPVWIGAVLSFIAFFGTDSSGLPLWLGRVLAEGPFFPFGGFLDAALWHILAPAIVALVVQRVIVAKFKEAAVGGGLGGGLGGEERIGEGPGAERGSARGGGLVHGRAKVAA